MTSYSPSLARRLAITRQRLAGPRPLANAEGLIEVVRDLGCLQLDSISVSHLFVGNAGVCAAEQAHR